MGKQPVETTLYSLEESIAELPRQRSAQRHLSLLRVGALTIADRRELCLIRNISARGMTIRVYSGISIGTPISIELKHGEPISGTATSGDGDSVEISFDAPVDVLSLIASSEDGPRPRMPRVEARCTVSLRQDGAVHRAKMLNISQGGLCVECAIELQVGANVIVSVNGLAPVPALIKWRDAELYGVGFNRVLALSELVAWLQQQHQRQKKAAG